LHDSLALPALGTPISFVRSNTDMAMVLVMPRAPTNRAIRGSQAVDRARTTNWLLLAHPRRAMPSCSEGRFNALACFLNALIVGIRAKRAQST
jgi:hypothetical protein